MKKRLLWAFCRLSGLRNANVRTRNFLNVGSGGYSGHRRQRLHRRLCGLEADVDHENSIGQLWALMSHSNKPSPTGRKLSRQAIGHDNFSRPLPVCSTHSQFSGEHRLLAVSGPLGLPKPAPGARYTRSAFTMEWLARRGWAARRQILSTLVEFHPAVDVLLDGLLGLGLDRREFHGALVHAVDQRYPQHLGVDLGQLVAHH